MDKQIVVYLRSGILLSHKKEWSTDIYYDMDEQIVVYLYNRIWLNNKKNKWLIHTI